MSINTLLFVGRNIDGSCPDVAGGGGGAGLQETTVNVIDNATDPNTDSQVIDITEFRGSYYISVQSSSTTGATATFVVSSGRDDLAGAIVRTSNSPGENNETINLIWPANSEVRVYHDTAATGGTGSFLEYRVGVLGFS